MKQFILYILYYDFFYYFLHRLLHTRLFYKIHKIHHLKIKPSFSDYYNVHILEIPLTTFGLFLAVYIHKIYIYQLIWSILFINIRGMLEHDDRFIFLVGDHHLNHHLLFTCNYGEYWLDFIFGTLCKKNTNNAIR
jgi:sterol desaturase/sphingolipid hydroxylase (fatty acid hydroxylase superfamily)